MKPSIVAFEHLLGLFRQLPQVSPREPTLLEITGYQRQELLSSNILAFYLDPAKPHGLGTTLLDALLMAAGAEPTHGQPSVTVRTEVTTTQGKRLDLVIDTGEIVVAIENKIDHTAINPFAEYQRELKKLSAGRPWIGVLLSLRSIAPSTAFHGFRPVTYATYFTVLAPLLERTIHSAREPYLIFLRDFMRTIQDLARETTMDAATLAFFQKNQADVEQLLSSIDALREDMKQKQQSLKNLIDTSVCGRKVTSGVTRPTNMLSDMLFYTVEVDRELHLRIVVHLNPTGWWINLYHAIGDQQWQRQAVETFLHTQHIPFQPRNYPHVWRLGYGSDMAYDTPLAHVQETLQGLFRQLGGLPHEG